MAQVIERRRRYTIDEYLRLESESDEKFEYWNGFVVSLSALVSTLGRTYEHSILCANVVAALGEALAGGPCHVAGGDLRVRGPRKPFYFHPDATVICGKSDLERHARSQDTLLNPQIIVEVLSPSTEAYDRGGKFRQYP